ncbi:MAG: CRTAC1 family protein [Planctomycetes bacterium]|nr:CRTAC1 family protein [Planctomycetota bacterium]
MSEAPSRWRPLLLAAAVALGAAGAWLAWPRGPVRAPGDPRSLGTLEMIERLEEWAQERDATAKRAYCWNSLRIPWRREQVEDAAGGPKEWRQRLQLAKELLHGGDPMAALAELDACERAFAAKSGLAAGSPDHAAAGDEFLRWRALCWLRLGEVENCLQKNCCESCVLPIAPSAQHAARRGSEEAIPLYVELLERHPDDLDARWLLNLAAMTLGRWPDAVPERYRVPAATFESQADFPRLRNVAPQAGIADTSLSGGACVEDFDGDGRLDLFTCSIGVSEPIHLYVNRGDGTFVDRAREAGLDGLLGGLNAVHADYDNDGDADVLVLRGAWWGEEGLVPNSLLRNTGDGRFEDVTEEAGLLSFHPTQTAQWRDFDGDGFLDLVVGNETEPGDDDEHPAELYWNRGDGRFEEVGERVGAAEIGWIKGVAAADYDGDGRCDLYYSKRNGRNVLLRNVAASGAPSFRFEEATAAAGLDEGVKMSFPAWFNDHDQDGDDDLFVWTNAPLANDYAFDVGKVLHGQLPAAPSRLFRNDGGRFTECAAAAGLDRAILSMGSNFGDLDGDGFDEIYLGNGSPPLDALLPNRLYKNDGGQRFLDVTFASGTGHLQKGHAVALGDLDDDGDLDLFLEVGGFFDGDVYPNVLYENPGHAHRWVTLHLQGTKANRSAIGARVRVELETPTGPRTLHHVVSTGGSFGSSSLRAELGLGDATAITAVEVRWPGSGALSRFGPLATERAWRLIEGATAAEPVPLRPFRFGAGESPR